jgi:molecular chaperone DnaK
MTDIVVGIDLGTTNSLIGYVQDGVPRLAADDKAEQLLPSAVGMDGSGALLVGRSARNRRLLDPEGTAVSVKRRMGQDVKVRVGTKELTPPQVSALILGALLDWVEREAGTRPTRAVITVPAYFDDAQREATRNAGLLAGLEVERLINEPTAAAMTFHTGEEQRVLVYDLGGGTFDVSILDRDAGFLEVRASRGDTQLGGDDIDAALVSHVLGRFDGNRDVVERDPRAMTRLLEAVERAKIALSDRSEVRLHEPFLAGQGDAAVHLDLTLRREDVEQVARPFIERTLSCIDNALRDAAVRAEQLDRVLLVGGASKMPLVAKMVGERLGRPAFVSDEADRAVALGASLVAARAAGLPIDEVLVDITPHSLSVGVLSAGIDYDGGIEDLFAARVIERNTVVPVERAETYFTVVENQPSIMTPIVQGEGEYVGDNTQLGNVVVDKLPPSPAGSPVEVRFRLDLSGLLHVTATHMASGRKAEVTIADSPYRLTELKRDAAKKEVQALREAQPVNEGPSDSELSLARALLARADKAMSSGSGDALVSVQAAREALQKAVDEADASVADKMDALSDALLDLM